MPLRVNDRLCVEELEQAVGDAGDVGSDGLPKCPEVGGGLDEIGVPGNSGERDQLVIAVLSEFDWNNSLVETEIVWIVTRKLVEDLFCCPGRVIP